MSISSAFQLVMLLLKVANWVTSRIDRAKWKRAGYNDALAETLAEFNRNIGIADKAVERAQSATPEQRKSILEDDL